MFRSGKVKSAPPRIGKVLKRRRLFRRLEAKPKPGALWIMGPPGSGKSTLVASHLEGSTTRCIWYPLDAGDADAGTFFHELQFAMRAIAPRGWRLLPRYTADARLNLGAYARRFFRAFYAALEQPCTVVLDNAQELPREAVIHKIIEIAIEELSQGSRLVLISRSAPPACYARLQASRLLQVLEGDMLPLSRAETGRLARLLLGRRSPSPALLEQLHSMSEGWAAGVVLLLDCLRAGSRANAADAGLSTHAAFDYFASELFSRLDDGAQQILLKCSLLRTITPAAAQRLCGSRRAALLLEELHANNYFVSLQPGPTAYQFHALFHRFLETRAHVVFPSSELNRLRRRAAMLLENRGRLQDALVLYAQANDWGEAIRLVLANAAVLVEQGRFETLSEWLGHIPQPVAQTQPWLEYWRAVCVLLGQPGSARALFEDTHAQFEQHGDHLGCTLSSAGVIDSILYDMGASKRLDPWITALEKGIRDTSAYPSPGAEARALISFFSALMIRQPEHPSIDAFARRLQELAARLGDVNLRLRAEHDVAWFSLFRGDMNQAFASMEGTGRIVRSHHPRPMATITQHAVETWFAMLAGEHDTCMRASRQALALAHETSVHIWSPQVLGNALASAVAAGDPETAARIRKDYVALSLERHPVDQSYRHCMLAWLHLSRGEHTAALRHQSTGLQLADEVGMPFLQALSHLGLAHVLQTRGDTHGATTYLSTALGIVERTRLGVLRFSCLLAAARFAFAREDLTAGMEHLRLALRHGCIHGCMNGYWWHSEWMGDLAERALRAKIEVPYVQDLVRRRALTTHSAPIDCPNWPWKARIYTLGRFQLIIDERVQRFNGKGQRRPLELLQALIAYGGREVPEQRLCDALWPDFDSDKAYVNLKMTLTRLRELLGDANLVVLSHGCLTLDAHRCWVDACDFERRLSRADAALKAGDRRAAWQALESALTLYRGPFLQSDNTGPWCLQPRERIRARLLRSVGGVGEALLAANDDEAALDCFGRGLEADPNAEVFYRGIIRCHMKLGRKAEAVDTYERCCRILGVDGRVPSAQTKALVWAS